MQKAQIPIMTISIKKIILIFVFSLSGCGYTIVKKSDLEFIKKANHGMGYINCLNNQNERLFAKEAKIAAQKTNEKYAKEITELTEIMRKF